NNTNMVAMTEVPGHLIVIGGSYVGLEFAQVFRRLGAQVTVVERGQHLIAREDTDVSLQVREILEAEGIRIRCGAECIQLHSHAEGAAVGVSGPGCPAGAEQIAGTHVLLAVGRRPNTDDLGLDKAGVATDARGY
ncbi:FAD-dependent oxidoreductase, partial [Cupriavidus sp. KB_39]|uniref:FAD-dependent oxidoreductase n=1 Tax=Cupriavidus sp. KB_39 TaxID=3233036 RepID=UPI003F8D91C0